MPGTSLPRTYQKEQERLEILTRRFAGNEDFARYRCQLCAADLEELENIFFAHFEADSPGAEQHARVVEVTAQCWRVFWARIQVDWANREHTHGLANLTEEDLGGLWWDLYQTRLATGAVPAGALEFAGKVMEGVRRWIANGGHPRGQAEPNGC